MAEYEGYPPTQFGVAKKNPKLPADVVLYINPRVDGTPPHELYNQTMAAAGRVGIPSACSTNIKLEAAISVNYRSNPEFDRTVPKGYEILRPAPGQEMLWSAANNTGAPFTSEMNAAKARIDAQIHSVLAQSGIRLPIALVTMPDEQWDYEFRSLTLHGMVGYRCRFYKDYPPQSILKQL
jgi:hypothetical protein